MVQLKPTVLKRRKRRRSRLRSVGMNLFWRVFSQCPRLFHSLKGLVTGNLVSGLVAVMRCGLVLFASSFGSRSSRIIASSVRGWSSFRIFMAHSSCICQWCYTSVNWRWPSFHPFLLLPFSSGLVRGRSRAVRTSRNQVGGTLRPCWPLVICRWLPTLPSKSARGASHTKR